MANLDLKFAEHFVFSTLLTLNEYIGCPFAYIFEANNDHSDC